MRQKAGKFPAPFNHGGVKSTITRIHDCCETPATWTASSTDNPSWMRRFVPVEARPLGLQHGVGFHLDSMRTRREERSQGHAAFQSKQLAQG